MERNTVERNTVEHNTLVRNTLVRNTVVRNTMKRNMLITNKVWLCAAAVASGFALSLAAAVAQSGPHPDSTRSAQTAAPVPVCVVPPQYARFEYPLYRTARQLAMGHPIKIVAVGSSSTYGAGASRPANSYPNRLESELASIFNGNEIRVINRGVNGDTDTDMLARFERGVVAEEPDLVLWQAGTNSLLRGDPIYPHWSLLQGGIARLKHVGADIVLIDPQYAPRVLARPNFEGMVALLEQTARLKSIDLFRRFALMRHWHEVERMPFDVLLSPDELHMNDFSYGCVARALGQAIAEAATRPLATAAASGPGKH